MAHISSVHHEIKICSSEKLVSKQHQWGLTAASWTLTSTHAVNIQALWSQPATGWLNLCSQTEVE